VGTTEVPSRCAAWDSACFVHSCRQWRTNLRVFPLRHGIRVADTEIMHRRHLIGQSKLVNLPCNNNAFTVTNVNLKGSPNGIFTVGYYGGKEAIKSPRATKLRSSWKKPDGQAMVVTRHKHEQCDGPKIGRFQAQECSGARPFTERIFRAKFSPQINAVSFRHVDAELRNKPWRTKFEPGTKAGVERRQSRAAKSLPTTGDIGLVAKP
jgi:hypothetical protein